VRESRSYLRRIAERRGAPGIPTLMPPRQLFPPALLPPAGLEAEPPAPEMPRRAEARVAERPGARPTRLVESRPAVPAQPSPEPAVAEVPQARERPPDTHPSAPIHARARAGTGAAPPAAAQMPSALVVRSAQTRRVPPAPPPPPRLWPAPAAEAPPTVQPGRSASRAATEPEQAASASTLGAAQRANHPAPTPQALLPTGGSEERAGPPDPAPARRQPRKVVEVQPGHLLAGSSAPIPLVPPEPPRAPVTRPTAPAAGLSIGTLEVRIVAPALPAPAPLPAPPVQVRAARDTTPALARGFPAFGLVQS
jgi:hypothetical protein